MLACFLVVSPNMGGLSLPGFETTHFVDAPPRLWLAVPWGATAILAVHRDNLLLRVAATATRRFPTIVCSVDAGPAFVIHDDVPDRLVLVVVVIVAVGLRDDE